MFVAVYVPHQHNNVHQAEASGIPVIDAANLAENIVGVVTSGLSLAQDYLMVAYTNLMQYKEYILDALVWAASKGLLAAITSSIVNWINSGFKGSPMFLQDFKGFMLHTADHIVGDFLLDLGGLASFICSPFQLDVRIALSMSYRASRGYRYGTCTLTGALSNIDNFVKGAGNFGSGNNQGWDTWFTITSQPQRYTPYGNLLEAQSQASFRIRNAQGQELSYLNFGSGFMSSKLCNNIDIAGVSKEQCAISTPGKVIEQALNFQLSSGSRSLIVADEIDEILGALMGQLVKQVVTGSAGLLGLSNSQGGASSYSDRLESDHLTQSTQSQADARDRQAQAIADAEAKAAAGETTRNASRGNATSTNNTPSPSPTNIGNTLAGASTNGDTATALTINNVLANQIAFETGYSGVANLYKDRLLQVGTPASIALANDTVQLLSLIQDNRNSLISIQDDLNNGIITTATAVTRYNNLSKLHTIADVDSAVTAAEAILNAPVASNNSTNTGDSGGVQNTVDQSVIDAFNADSLRTASAINTTQLTYLPLLVAVSNNNSNPNRFAAAQAVLDINNNILPLLKSILSQLESIAITFQTDQNSAATAYENLLNSSTPPPSQQDIDNIVAQWVAITS